MPQPKEKRLEHRNDIEKLVHKFKAGGCTVCNEKCIPSLVAHHLDPKTKKYEIGKVKQRNLSLVNVQIELDKCVCLCHNCHYKLHAGMIELTDGYDSGLAFNSI